VKDSIIIKLHQPASRDFPSWQQLLHDKAGGEYALSADIDSIIRKNKVPVWVTREYDAMKRGGWTKEEVSSGLNRIYRLILKNDRKFSPELVRQISLLPEVEYAHAPQYAEAELPRYQSHQLAQGRPLMRGSEAVVKEAHSYSRGMPSVKIAVLDTGIEAIHPEFAGGRMQQGFDFVNIINGQQKFTGDFLGLDDMPEDEVGHGTHVSGIIAARGQRMAVGVAPNCTILPVKVLGAFKRGASVVGAGTIQDINAGIKYAVDEGASIINMSLGVKHEGGGLPHAEVVDYARKRGVTIVAASGNDGTRDKYFPGANPYVIAIGAVDPQGEVANFSTRGAHISFVAPGTNIYSTYLRQDYAFSSGTSQAAPFVSGAIALLKSYALRKTGRTLKDADLKRLLMTTADRSGRSIKTINEGFGAINLPDALKLLNYQMN